MGAPIYHTSRDNGENQCSRQWLKSAGFTAYLTVVSAKILTIATTVKFNPCPATHVIYGAG